MNNYMQAYHDGMPTGMPTGTDFSDTLTSSVPIDYHSWKFL